MKHPRALKLLLVVMLLALPLLLSGCYVTPDIPANNNSGSDLNFPEYNPSTAVPTAAPTTAAPTDYPGGVVTLPTASTNTWSTVAPVVPLAA